MIKRDVVVNLPQDAEARPVAVLVQLASKYDSKVNLAMGDKHVNVKSIMGMMSLGLVNGKGLTLSAEGDDEAEAVDELANYIQSV